MSFNLGQNQKKLRSVKGRDFVKRVPVLGNFSLKATSDHVFKPWSERVLDNVYLNIRSEREHRARLRNVLSKHVNQRKSKDCVNQQEAEISNKLNEAIAETERFLSDMSAIVSEIKEIKRDRERERKYNVESVVNVCGEDIHLFTSLVDVDGLFSVEDQDEVDTFIARRFYSLQNSV